MPPTHVDWDSFERMSKRANVAEAQRDEAFTIITDQIDATKRKDNSLPAYLVLVDLVDVLRQSFEKEDAVVVQPPPGPNDRHVNEVEAESVQALRAALLDARGFVDSHSALSAPEVVERIDRALTAVPFAHPSPYAHYKGQPISERSPGVEMIEVERYRQVIEEDYDADHDDSHTGQTLARAAAAYADPRRIYAMVDDAHTVDFSDVWPWAAFDDKRHHRPWLASEIEDPAVRRERVRELVKAGALVAAEIDRLERMP